MDAHRPAAHRPGALRLVIGAALIAAVAGFFAASALGAASGLTLDAAHPNRTNPHDSRLWVSGHRGDQRLRQAPVEISPSPDAEIFGDGEVRVATLIEVGQLDDDGAADLLVSQQPDGLVSREATYVIAGRNTWASRTRFAQVGASEIVPRQARSGAGVAIIGVDDLDGDGRTDFAATRTQYPGPSPNPTEFYWYLGPEDLPRGGQISPDRVTELDGPTENLRIWSADPNGDGDRDVLLADAEQLAIYLLGVDSDGPSSVMTPTVDTVFASDFDADGTEDLMLNVASDVIDVAFLAGRSIWAERYHLPADADWTLGTGNDRYEVRYAQDLNGDAVPDLALMDMPAGRLNVYLGAEDFGANRVPDNPDWWIEGVELTDRDTELADLTGDGLPEIIVNRTVPASPASIFLGLTHRQGAYAVGSDDVDALWPEFPEGHFRSGDVDGDGIIDVLVNDPGATGVGSARGAGVIRVFLGPVWDSPGPTPTPRTTYTSTPEPTDTPTREPSPTATATGRPTDGPGSAIYLPLARADRE